MSREPSIESLMRHDVPRVTRRKARNPWRTTPRRCEVCKKEPPVCECPKEAS